MCVIEVLVVKHVAGTDDTTVPMEWGSATASSLVLRGVEVKFMECTDTEHEISEEQVGGVRRAGGGRGYS